MKKLKRFLAIIGSIAVAVIGCYLFAAGFNQLFATNFVLNMFGAACLMVGVYDFCIGWLMLVKVLSGKVRVEINYYDHGGKDENK